MIISTYLANALLDHTLGGSTYTPAGTVYLALFTAAPSDAGGGTEATGGSYARQSVTFDAAATRAAGNDSVITFPVATADWGTVSYAAIMDASTAGNMLYYGPLSAPRTVLTDDQFKVPVAGLVMSFI